MLIVGGIVLLVRRPAGAPSRAIPTSWTIRSASRFGIGLFQCLALIPGVSRSGATIVGALLLGTDKRSAAEFSFFLAMPTMAGAFAFDLYKNRDIIDASQIGLDRDRLRRGVRRRRCWSCARCSTSSAGTALRPSPGGGLRWAQWGWRRC